MKRLLLVPFVLLFSVVAFAQGTSMDIPASKMEELGKPFIGIWNGVSCQQPKVMGIRIKFEQPNVTEAPVFTILQTVNDGKLDKIDETWGTVAFKSRVDDGGITRNLIFVTNNTLLVTLTSYNDKLLGLVSQPPSDEASPLALAPVGSTSLEEFTKANSIICTDAVARRKFFGMPEPK